MNMKKLMAGIAASALAVTSLATVASAETFAEFAKFTGVADAPLDDYTVTVDLKGSVVGMTDGGKLTLNVATGSVTKDTNGVVTDVKNPYYYAKNSENYGVLINSDIYLVFKYRGADLKIKGIKSTDGTTTEWTVDTNSGLTSGKTYAEVKTYVDNAANVGKIPADASGFSLDIARIEFDVELYSTVAISDTNPEKKFYTKLTNDLSDVIKNTDITNYGVSDALQLNFGTDLTNPDVIIKVDNVVSQESLDYSLAVKRGPYTVKNNYAPYAVTAGSTFRFYTEDVGSFDEGVGAAGNSWARRLNVTQQTDVRNLKEDANMTVTVKFYGKVNDDNVGFGVITDLMRWRGDTTHWQPIAKGASEVTFTLPVKNFYDSDYRVGYSSGFLGKLEILWLDGSKFDTPAGHSADILEVLIQYDKDDITGTNNETPGGSDNNATVEEKPVTIDIPIDGGYRYELTYTQSALYGKADKLKVTADVVDDEVIYHFTLTDGGKASNLNGEVTIKMYAPEGRTWAAGQTTIPHYKNDGTVEEIAIINVDTYVDDTYIEFKTSSFSGFGGQLDPVDTDEPEETEPAPEETEPAPEETEPAPEVTEPAPSGDNGAATTNPPTGVIIAVVPAIVAAAGVVIAKKRK